MAHSRRALCALAVGVVCVAAAACSSSKSKSPASGSSLQQNCYVLPGSSVAFKPATGAAYDGTPFLCDFYAGKNGALLYFLSSAQGTSTNRSELWVYVQTAPIQGSYSLVPSSLGSSYFSEGFEVGEPPLEQLGLAPGSIMASMDAPATVTYDSVTGSPATAVSLALPASDTWPTLLGDTGGAVLTFAAAAMTDRTSPTSTATLTGTIKVQLGVSTYSGECLAPVPAGSVGCVDADQTCDATGGCSGKCAGTICSITLTSIQGICCLPDGVPCGTAGTGTECCGGLCTSEGLCADDPSQVGLCSGASSSSGAGTSSSGSSGGASSGFGGGCMGAGVACNPSDNDCCIECGLHTAGICD